MGVMNRIRRVIHKVSLIVCVVGLPVSAQAFTQDENVDNNSRQDWGNCYLNTYVKIDDGYAEVYISQRVFDDYMGVGNEGDAGGFWYDGSESVIDSNKTLTGAIVAKCLGVDEEDIINYSAIAATSPPNFANQETMGFSFTISDDANLPLEYLLYEGSFFPVAGGTYSYYIGNQPETALPSVVLSGPSDIVTDAFTVTATFSENVVGFELGDITVTNGTASALVANDAPVYTFTVTPELGTTVSVSIIAGVADDAQGNENTASNTLSVQAGSPGSYFAEQEAEIKAIITQDATRNLTSTLSSNQRMTRGARSRFIESRSQSEGDGAGLATRNNVPFDVDGTFDLDGARVSSKGTFFGQTGNVEGTERRLVFGDFDVQRDGDTGSTTATLTGRVAWEQMISDDTMLGYFVGGELADSNISGAFEGKQTRVAATAGGYAVRALSETLFADGFISIGAGRNNLEMADDVLALESTYTTRTATVGGALTGVYAYERYELRPEMAFSYGKTWIGDVGFTGVAYGLTDNTLSVDAGTVSTASLTLRPEIVWALDAETVAGSNAQLSFAPRFICERTTTATTTQNCGAGAEIGLSSNSEDGLSSANIRFVMDRVGNSNRSNVMFNVEYRF